jgi:hypothetical protein
LELFAATDRETFRSGDVVFGARAYRSPRYERGSAYDASSCPPVLVLVEVMTGQRSSKSQYRPATLAVTVTQKIFRLMLRVPLQQVSSNHWSSSTGRESRCAHPTAKDCCSDPKGILGGYTIQPSIAKHVADSIEILYYIPDTRMNLRSDDTWMSAPRFT